MDLSAFNARARAEQGAFVALRDPYTKEPIGEGDNAPGFRVRGIAARQVQASLAEMQRKARAKAAQEGDDRAAMEALHEQMIDSAMRYIIRAENLEHDGKAVGDDKSAIRAVLDYTFPDFAVVKDADGKPETVEIKGEDGKTVTVPRMEIRNLTFAAQVIEAAEDTRRFLGNSATA